MTGLLVLFILVASATPKLLGAKAALDSFDSLGWSPRYLLMIGFIEIGCMILFVIPKTSLLGAILTTGLLGGAMASHIRIGNPLFSHTLFSIYLGVFMWISLWLRNESLRTIFPLISN